MMGLEQDESKYLDVRFLFTFGLVHRVHGGSDAVLLPIWVSITPESVATSGHSDLAAYPDHDEARAYGQVDLRFHKRKCNAVKMCASLSRLPYRRDSLPTDLSIGSRLV